MLDADKSQQQQEGKPSHYDALLEPPAKIDFIPDGNRASRASPKPAFDPSKLFDVVEEPPVKSAFDPSTAQPVERPFDPDAYLAKQRAGATPPPPAGSKSDAKTVEPAIDLKQIENHLAEILTRKSSPQLPCTPSLQSVPSQNQYSNAEEVRFRQIEQESARTAAEMYPDSIKRGTALYSLIAERNRGIAH